MKIPQKIRVNYFDLEVLMAQMLGKAEQFENDDIENLEEEFYEKFDVDSEQFQKIVEHLMPYTVLSKSDLSDEIRIGFVNHNEGVYIVKENIQLEKVSKEA